MISVKEKLSLINELTNLRCIVRAHPQYKNKFLHIHNLIERIYDPKTPSYKLSLKECNGIGNLELYHLLDKNYQTVFDSILQSLSSILKSRGYRYDIHTAQEHKLFGSSEGADAKNPYVPLGILSGSLTVQETQTARDLSIFSYSIGRYYGDFANFMVAFYLEPLDSNGQTLQDPRLINPIVLDANWDKNNSQYALNLALSQVSKFEKSSKYPFRRD